MLDWGVYECCLTKANIRDRKQKLGTDIISKSQFFRLDPDLNSAPPRGSPQPHGQLNAQLPPLQTAQAAVPTAPHLYPDLNCAVEEGDRPPHTPQLTRKVQTNSTELQRLLMTQMGPKWREFSRTGAENGETSMGHADKRHCSRKTGHE